MMNANYLFNKGLKAVAVVAGASISFGFVWADVSSIEQPESIDDQKSLAQPYRVADAGSCCSAEGSGSKGHGPGAENAQSGCCSGEQAGLSAGKASGGVEEVAQRGRGGGGHGKGRMGRGKGGKGGGPKRAVMQNARTLVFNHGSITRTVTEIPGGVVTKSTTTDPNLVATLQKHPKEMYELYGKGGSVRHWDPLFQELARVGDSITMEFTELEDGIQVKSTSPEPEVVKLIRAHAYKVNEFVKRGMESMHESTPLPEDYTRPRE